jgi:hypothetical protein
MKNRTARLLLSSAAAATIAFAVPAAALAAGHHARHAHTTRAHVRAGVTGATGPAGNPADPEVALSGTTLASATAAALAAVPGTVESATTETDGTTGAYEVIVTKSDGSRVKVIEDSSFTVLSSAATGCR